ncbi:unnamed protein product [Linum trigynum]|uniref:Protein FAR1-RELATED SEQUENCE n=1 Tax=Linum trigynum TaxID=586398 RepID=A0AAV2EQ99_9ROSI
MLTTQACKSCNASVRHFLKPNRQLDQFFIHFNTLVEDKRYKERTLDFESIDQVPAISSPFSNILKQVAEIYTPRMYRRVEKQYQQMVEYELEPHYNGRDGGFIGYTTFYTKNDVRWDEHVVFVDVANAQLECGCRLFNSMGIICRHILKVMVHLGNFVNLAMKILPEHFILKRWTIHAKKKEVGESSTSARTDEAPYTANIARNTTALRYRETTAMLNKLSTKLSIADDGVYEKWMKALSKMCKLADHALSRSITSETGGSQPLNGLTMKQKVNPRSHGRERYKSRNEKARGKKKIQYAKHLKDLEILSQVPETQRGSPNMDDKEDPMDLLAS